MKRIYKVLLIVGIVIVALVSIVAILCGTVFTVKEVSVEYRTSLINLQNKESEIIELAEIKTGKCIFFQKKTEYAERIEERMPYADVVNIESAFPNKLIIHIAEREEYFEFKSGNDVIVVDPEFKVLRILNDFTGENIKLENIRVLGGNIFEGEFLETDANVLNGLNSALFENNRTVAEQKALFKSISVGTHREPTTRKEEVYLSFKLNSGFECVIYYAENKLTEKCQKLLACLAVLSPEDIQTKFLIIGDLFDTSVGGGIYSALEEK